MYPVSDEISNSFEIKIPIKYRLDRTLKNSLNLDYEQLPNYYPFSKKSIAKLRDAFGVLDQKEIVSDSEIKRKLMELISTGRYTNLTELAKDTGYSNSYISRVLKHKK